MNPACPRVLARFLMAGLLAFATACTRWQKLELQPVQYIEAPDEPLIELCSGGTCERWTWVALTADSVRGMPARGHPPEGPAVSLARGAVDSILVGTRRLPGGKVGKVAEGVVLIVAVVYLAAQPDHPRSTHVCNGGRGGLTCT